MNAMPKQTTQQLGWVAIKCKIRYIGKLVEAESNNIRIELKQGVTIFSLLCLGPAKMLNNKGFTKSRFDPREEASIPKKRYTWESVTKNSQHFKH